MHPLTAMLFGNQTQPPMAGPAPVATNPIQPTATMPPQPQPQGGMPGMKDLFDAFTRLAQIQGQNQLAVQQQGLMAPASRHLGMSGEDITNKTGPYDSGGIDWLKGHNDGSGGAVGWGQGGYNHADNFHSQLVANNQQNAWAGANDPGMQPTGAEHMLPSTVALATPGLAMPQGGMYSPQWPAHVQAVQQQLANTQGAIARTKGMFPSW